MQYSLSAIALAAACVTLVSAAPSGHNHARAHAKKSNDLLERQAVEIVYVTKTVMWDDPSLATETVYVAPSSFSSSSSSLTTSAIKTPVKQSEVIKPSSSSAAAVYSAAPVVVASSSTSTAKAAASSSTATESNVLISTSAVKSLLALGVSAVGTNAVASNGGAWIGTDGSYTMEMVNAATEDITVVVWGTVGSWVNVKVPAITISLAKGAKKTVSFADSYSGAFSAIYSDTKLVNGQISNTWGECTFNSAGVCDVSREVNMSGHDLSIVGPSCTSNMSTCVFVCDSGNVCTTGYSLLNCAAGSQPGAQSGVDTYGNGGASGGCGWLGASKAALTATFS